jgi:hypothetical protein
MALPVHQGDTKVLTTGSSDSQPSFNQPQADNKTVRTPFPRKKSLQERQREMVAEMKEFEAKAAVKLGEIEKLIPLGEMAEMASSNRRLKYEAFLKNWALSPNESLRVLDVITRRDNELARLRHESILAGKGTQSGMEGLREAKLAKEEASQELEVILGKVKANELSVWEREQFGTIKVTRD